MPSSYPCLTRPHALALTHTQEKSYECIQKAFPPIDTITCPPAVHFPSHLRLAKTGPQPPNPAPLSRKVILAPPHPVKPRTHRPPTVQLEGSHVRSPSLLPVNY